MRGGDFGARGIGRGGIGGVGYGERRVAKHQFSCANTRANGEKDGAYYGDIPLEGFGGLSGLADAMAKLMVKNTSF